MQFNPGVAEWLLDHLIRPRQHIRRDRQADLLRGFQVDHELDLRRLLNRQISRLGTFKDLVTDVDFETKASGVFVQSI